MSNLDMAFKAIGANNVEVINCNDVVAIDSQSLYIHNEKSSYRIDEFSSSFVRYPYDLIPPHSETFELREETEYHKTLALALDAVSVNSLASTWMLRNRAYSLNQAQAFGVNIAEYTIAKKRSILPTNGKKAVKALGNCFVSSNTESLSQGVKDFFRIEEDDGDLAAIFPASSLNAKSIDTYISNIGVAFLQQEVKAINEFRGYIVGEVTFVYVREDLDCFDKSAAKYISTNYKCTHETKSGLRKLMNEFNLRYLCFDFLLDESNEEIIIDINPYGSMPKYSSHPEPSLQLAQIMME